MKPPGITRARRPFLAPLWVGGLVLVLSVLILMTLFRLGSRHFGETITVIVLRHAEKTLGFDDPPLASAGIARAERLASMLRDAGVDAIYVSDTRRARETAAPLAARLQLRAVEYPARDIEALAAQLKDHERGSTVLVVGHSNTAPQIVATLAGGSPVASLADDEYDALYVVTLNRFDPPSVLRLRY